MTTLSSLSQARDARMTILHAGAIASAILSGAYALVALAVSTPFEFGVALAVCGASWIAADYVERTAERARVVHRRVAARPSHTVFIGGSGLNSSSIAPGSPMTCESPVCAATASPPGSPNPPTLVAASARWRRLGWPVAVDRVGSH